MHPVDDTAPAGRRAWAAGVVLVVALLGCIAALNHPRGDHAAGLVAGAPGSTPPTSGNGASGAAVGTACWSTSPTVACRPSMQKSENAAKANGCKLAAGTNVVVVGDSTALRMYRATAVTAIAAATSDDAGSPTCDAWLTARAAVAEGSVSGDDPAAPRNCSVAAAREFALHMANKAESRITQTHGTYHAPLPVATLGNKQKGPDATSSVSFYRTRYSDELVMTLRAVRKAFGVRAAATAGAADGGGRRRRKTIPWCPGAVGNASTVVAADEEPSDDGDDDVDTPSEATANAAARPKNAGRVKCPCRLRRGAVVVVVKMGLWDALRPTMPRHGFEYGNATDANGAAKVRAFWRRHLATAVDAVTGWLRADPAVRVVWLAPSPPNCTAKKYEGPRRFWCRVVAGLADATDPNPGNGDTANAVANASDSLASVVASGLPWDFYRTIRRAAAAKGPFVAPRLLVVPPNAAVGARNGCRWPDGVHLAQLCLPSVAATVIGTANDVRVAT